MKVEKTSISGPLIIYPDVFEDPRGYFYESYNADKFKEMGIIESFNQSNHSKSVKGTLRGLHFQVSPGQSKLVRVIRGSVWDVAVDIRPSSKTFGKWHAVELNEENRMIYYVPVGFAHGFCVLSETTEFLYKVSSVYNPKTESGIAWDDPDINIEWPIKSPLLSERDMKNQSLKEFLKKVQDNPSGINWK